ncbi:radical SAM/SPASM domain-containing protein [Antribacter gilvus]|uniref:radical SAM/SPASM domain-containing protein n=1 Tax=Antribacter gilvus TaxID=2304675 RepID=UPI000F76EFD9|nr:radical SAM protein [Antribacter gilvus]
MAAVAVELHGSRFDPARVHAQVRGDALLLMDRVSGRWGTVPAVWVDLLPMTVTASAAATSAAATALREYMIEHDIGTRGGDRSFGTLNTLIIKLTAACNHACTYCYDFEATFGARRIDPAVALKTVEEALDECDGSLQVILHGGEPMLVWDLVEDLVVRSEAAAVQRGKVLRFVGQSNMSLLSARIGRFSVEHDIVWGVSVDGPADVHDHFRVYRNGRGTYADFARSLEAFPNFMRTCGVLSTVTRANEGRLLEVAAHFRDLGMPSWDWTLFQAIGRGRHEADRFEPDVETVVASWVALYDAVCAGEFHGFPVVPVLSYVQNFVRGPGPNMCMRPQCGAARDLASISVDGTIEACDCIDRTGPLAGLGDAKQVTLAQARATPQADTIRGRDLSATRCSTCTWFGVCGGGCLAHAASRDEIPPLACALALTAFDRIAGDLVRPGGDLRRYLASVGADAP